MGEYAGITQELREQMAHTTMAGKPMVEMGRAVFDSYCDNIDAIHRSLEKKNECLHERLQELDNADSSMQIGEVTVTITPRIDWTAIADDLRDAAKALCERTREGEE